jgi:hypothetical protein
LTAVNIVGDSKGRAASEPNASIMVRAMRAVLRTIDGRQCNLARQKGILLELYLEVRDDQARDWFGDGCALGSRWGSGD